MSAKFTTNVPQSSYFYEPAITNPAFAKSNNSGLREILCPDRHATPGLFSLCHENVANNGIILSRLLFQITF